MVTEKMSAKKLLLFRSPWLKSEGASRAQFVGTRSTPGHPGSNPTLFTLFTTCTPYMFIDIAITNTN